MSSLNKLTAMRNFYDSGNTRSFEFRRQQLQKLKEALLKNEAAVYAALFEDLKKSREESWVTEIGFVFAELNNALKNLAAWMRPEKVSTNLLNFPSKSSIVSEPLGVVLIIGPWNYPMQLLFTPLVGAIAAGNCIVLKSSEFSSATTTVMKKIIEENFDPAYILFTEGDGATVVPEMIRNFVFDHIFYTGSIAVGKIIYQMAAPDLVPVTLELGGKSPCIVESDANIKIAARRIALAKFSNAGQMCVAPDYVLVHVSRKEELVNEIRKKLKQFFGEDAKASESYGKIINEKQFDRLVKYFDDGKTLVGGRVDRSKLYIEPSVIDQVDINSKVMTEEIFGPILPVLTFSTMKEALQIIDRNRNPLAFYIFTSDSKKETSWLNAVPFGGGCVNNTGWHLTNHHLPFGGRGCSGTGRYHGKYSFQTFSHKKSVMKTPTWFDPSIKYPPFQGKLKFFKWLIK
jgi:aldehyde dehydrogenase (NAD+)